MTTGLSEREYRRRVNAWCMYDWANSAFATTILAVVLPVYYSQVAGATLPSKAIATSYWSLGLSISLFIVALLSPILGTMSDVVRSKKRFLAFFASLGIIGTGLLVLVDTGDWLLASILFVIGRIGFTASIIFSDALLPHVARRDDQDRVSTRAYALGYLGGGLLLAINVVMIQLLPGTWGPRLSFLSVAIWWAVFAIPLFVRIPEPPAATARFAPGENVVTVSFRRLWTTLKDVHRYRELFKFLIAFLIYNDGIGTVIGVAAIYGAELGFGSIELILAVLLVQFVGIPFSLIFGRLPSKADRRRPLYLAFILFNLVVLPLASIVGARALPREITGAPLPPYADTPTHVGEGAYPVDHSAYRLEGTWSDEVVAAGQVGADQDVLYRFTDEPGARIELPFNGQQVKLTYSTGPDRGIWAVEIDAQPYLDPDTGKPFTLDAYHKTVRYEVSVVVGAEEPGEHVLSLVNTGSKNAKSRGTRMSVARVEVLPPLRQNDLLVIIGFIILLEVLGGLFAWLLGRRLFERLAQRMDTRRSIILGLVVYTVIVVWGFFLNSTIEFWLLAWMVAMVQGGSQALSRSLYASMSPAAKSGEFFGLYGVMEKFSAIIGPLFFAAAAAAFDSSRPAVLSLVVLFVLGIVLLRRVDIDAGRRVAQEEDAALLG